MCRQTAAVLASLLCLNLWHSHSEGPLQVNTRWQGRAIHLRPEGQGPWRPTKTTKTTQQSIGMRVGYAGADKV
eukprot:scaffold53633_cov23-Cyclotella_meneghiniana.AAC.1